MGASDKTEKFSISINHLSILLLFVFSVGVFLGSGFMTITAPHGVSKKKLLELYENFKYISSGVSAKDGNEHLFNKELSPFRYKINDLIEDKIRKEEIRAASVYFRDLDNGNWFGIREKEKFLPKNLL